MNYLYIIWFTLGVVTFWLKPGKHLNGKERLQHFLFCLFLGPALLHEIINDLKAKEKKDDETKNKKND